MNSEKSNNFNSSKPKHVLKYQSIFKELLNNQNLFANNENEKQKHQTSNDFFYFQNNPMKNSLYSTRYQLITGKNIDTNSFLNKNRIRNQSNNITNQNINNSLMYKTEKQENIKKFKRFLKQTDLQYSTLNNNSFNHNFIHNYNNNNAISFNRNSFIQKLHSTLPEYTSLSNNGNSFLTLNNQTFKNSDFSYLRNKLK